MSLIGEATVMSDLRDALLSGFQALDGSDAASLDDVLPDRLTD